MTALLACDRVRIDVAGVPLVEQLSFETRADRVGLIGAPGAVFRLLSGEAELAGGSLAVAGLDPRQAIERGELGLALGELELPGDLQALEYLELAARLSGQRRGSARRAAEGLLEAWQLQSLAGRRCRELWPAEQRVLSLAQAAIGDPAVLAASQLFHGLEPSGQAFVAERLARAGSGHRLLLGFEGELPDPFEQELLRGLDELLVIGRSGLLAQAAPHELFGPTARYRLNVLSHASALVERIATRGVRVIQRAEPAREVPEQLLIELPDGVTPASILEDSLQVGAVVLELIPVWPGARGGPSSARGP